MREAGAEPCGCGAEVETVHRHRERVVAVGVEALHELVSLVGEVGADGELLFELGGHVARMQAVAAELLLHRLRREVGDVTEHPRERETHVGAGFLVGVLAVVEIRVAEDRVAADDIEREGLHREAWGGGHGQRAAHPVWVAGRPLEDLVPAHRTADHAAKDLHPEVVHELLLDLDDVGGGDRREVGPVGAAGRRVGAVRTGGPAAAAEDVWADHEVAVSVDGFAGAYDDVPPARVIGGAVARHMGIAAERVADKDGVVAGAIEPSPGLVEDGDLRQPPAELEAEVPEGDRARVAERPRAADAVAALEGGARGGLHGAGVTSARP